MYNDRNSAGGQGGGGSRGGFGGGQGGGYGASAPRQMFTGNWTCGTCGGAITELPFEPDPSRLGTLKCRDCHKKSRQDRPDFRSGGGQGGGGYNRF